MDLLFFEPPNNSHRTPKESRTRSHATKHSKFGTLSFNLSSIETLLGVQKPDRLSALPAEIKDVILSKLISSPNFVTSPTFPRCAHNPRQIQFTTKYAIRHTSVLSKRWRYAWTTCPKLTFLRSEFPSDRSFGNFVNRTLTMRGQSPLTTFEIYWTAGTVDISCISTWLYYAMQCGVQEIALYVLSVDLIELPPSLFRCPRLKVLDVVAAHEVEWPWSRPCFLQLPASIDVRNLRCLDLQFVKCSPRLLEKLISGSPLLESLKLGTCYQSIQISAPNLRTLHLYCTMRQVQISAPKLESLAFHLYSHATILAGDFRFLIDAYVMFIEPKGSIWNVSNFLISLRHARVLNLKGDAIESLSKLPLNEQICPRFCNLKHLSIHTALVTKNIGVIIMMLQRCPRLDTLVLYNTKTGQRQLDASGDYEVPWRLEYSLGFSSLRRVVINPFFGEKVEFQLVKFFLSKAFKLSAMNISGMLSPPGSRSRQLICKKLCAFPKASSYAKVLITDDVL